MANEIYADKVTGNDVAVVCYGHDGIYIQQTPWIHFEAGDYFVTFPVNLAGISEVKHYTPQEFALRFKSLKSKQAIWREAGWFG